MADGQHEETWGEFFGKWAGRALIAGGAIAAVSFLGAPALQSLSDSKWLDGSSLATGAETASKWISSHVAGVGNTLGADVFSSQGLAALGTTQEKVLTDWGTMWNSVKGMGSEIFGVVKENGFAAGAIGAGALGTGLLLSSSKSSNQPNRSQPPVGVHTARLQASLGGYGVGVNAGRT